jgi:hypothetical protein
MKKGAKALSTPRPLLLKADRYPLHVNHMPFEAVRGFLEGFAQ